MSNVPRYTVRLPRPARTAAALLLLLVAAASPLRAQATATVAGRVLDPRGAAVREAQLSARADDGAVRRTESDSAGRFQLGGLAPGRYRLVAEQFGYQRAELTVRLAAGERREVELRMRPDTLRVEGVVVRGLRDTDRERARFETDPGVTARVIRGEDLKILPGLAEADVMRAVEVLPGVISTSDFSSAFNVRGGSADQNLIELDGFPLFNPFHLGGLFSVFNSDAIARAELLAGGFGAEYGGRVSSVLNVETRSSAGEGLRVEGGVSMLASRVLVRSGLSGRASRLLGGQSGSWLVSARRSYFDQLLKPVVDFPYYLTDLQAFAELETRGGGRLSVSSYGGADVLDLSDFEPPGGDSSSVLRVRWNWGNRMVGVRWRQPVGRAWVSDSRVGYSRFYDEISFRDFGGARFGSNIRQLSLHSDWDRSLGESATLAVGALAQRLRYHNLAEAGGTSFFDNQEAGVLGSTYASVRWEPGERWLVEPGVRLDGWRASGDTKTVLSPRFAVKRFLGTERDAAVKLSVGRYAQFLHSLRDESLPVSNDTWITAGPGTPAVVSDQVQVGVEKYWGDRWSASLEAYWRDFEGITEINFADDPNDPLDDQLAGAGRSYGVDLLVRRDAGRLTGWTTVSLLRATRTLPDLLAAGWADLPPTVSFPPLFDRRMDVDLVLQYEGPYRIQLGARANYGSPLPYTRPVAQYFAWEYSPLGRRFVPADQQGDPLYVSLGRRNLERYPAYHRLDLTVRRTFRPRWGSWTPYLQVLNAYNRRNVLFYFYNYDRIPPTRSGISMFPVLPAIGVEMAF